MEGIIQRIVEMINSKGWNIYYQGKSDEKFSEENMYKMGPVKALEKYIVYRILPQVDEPYSQTAVENFLKNRRHPTITVPFGFPNNLGRKKSYGAGPAEPECKLCSGEEIPIVGIKLLDKEIQLIAATETFMPYNVFLLAVGLLQDTTERQATGKA